MTLLSGTIGAESPGSSVPGIDIPSILLRVRYVRSENLMPSERDEMFREVERIWSPHDVRFEWILTDEVLQGTTPADLIVVLMDGPPRLRDVGGRIEHDLGALTRRAALPPGETSRAPGAAIRIWWIEAQRLATASVQAVSADERRQWTTIRAPIIAGRALAHEVGHYLLGSGHTNCGLMRQSYTSTDALPRDEGFELDDEQAARIHDRRLALLDRNSADTDSAQP